jgi:bifunctional DNA-binding transcriptional regulator/antitoxin component of YhaV-PrlF toxin-antitoxin module
VGSKGELFPPKEIRKRLGLRAHMKVIYKIESGRLVVEPVPSLEEVLKAFPQKQLLKNPINTEKNCHGRRNLRFLMDTIYS